MKPEIQVITAYAECYQVEPSLPTTSPFSTQHSDHISIDDEDKMMHGDEYSLDDDNPINPK